MFRHRSHYDDLTRLRTHVFTPPNDTLGLPGRTVMPTGPTPRGHPDGPTTPTPARRTGHQDQGPHLEPRSAHPTPATATTRPAQREPECPHWAQESSEAAGTPRQPGPRSHRSTLRASCWASTSTWKARPGPRAHPPANRPQPTPPPGAGYPPPQPAWEEPSARSAVTGPDTSPSVGAPSDRDRTAGSSHPDGKARSGLRCRSRYDRGVGSAKHARSGCRARRGPARAGQRRAVSRELRGLRSIVRGTRGCTGTWCLCSRHGWCRHPQGYPGVPAQRGLHSSRYPDPGTVQSPTGGVHARELGRDDAHASSSSWVSAQKFSPS